MKVEEWICFKKYLNKLEQRKKQSPRIKYKEGIRSKM